ncbi:MAG: 2-C-methyl-D-erythritol 4-phosphate cytidylyltransferase, partial [Candidatus Omnitrophica bacterium]|nr:2-C-methyl-D-erythritol 4-phosphate cytidylyltransferase [Candidatus Omnitrophota bacterium]
MRAAIVIPAAGLGKRFRSPGKRKPFVQLNGRPMLIWTLKAFEAVPQVAEIVIAAHPKDIQAAWKQVKKYRCRKVSAIVPGGKTRADSVYCGLRAVSKSADVVAVHDAARPLVAPGLIQRVLKMAHRRGAALAA